MASGRRGQKIVYRGSCPAAAFTKGNGGILCFGSFGVGGVFVLFDQTQKETNMSLRFIEQSDHPRLQARQQFFAQIPRHQVKGRESATKAADPC
jgi:hypothetical protein